jgi:hypothetical protein
MGVACGVEGCIVLFLAPDRTQSTIPAARRSGLAGGGPPPNAGGRAPTKPPSQQNPNRATRRSPTHNLTLKQPFLQSQLPHAHLRPAVRPGTARDRLCAAIGGGSLPGPKPHGGRR